MGSNSAPTIAFEWMTPIWGWINQHDQQKCWLDTLFFHDRSSFQDTGTISKSMPDFSQTFLQNLNCEKWRKRLQPHLKVTLCKCTQLLDFILQWNKRIHTSSISNSRKGALPRLGTTVPVDVFQVFIFKIWPTLTKIPPPKNRFFSPKKTPCFEVSKNCGSIFGADASRPLCLNSSSPLHPTASTLPTFQRPVWSFLHAIRDTNFKSRCTTWKFGLFLKNTHGWPPQPSVVSFWHEGITGSNVDLQEGKN